MSRRLSAIVSLAVLVDGCWLGDCRDVRSIEIESGVFTASPEPRGQLPGVLPHGVGPRTMVVDRGRRMVIITYQRDGHAVEERWALTP